MCSHPRLFPSIIRTMSRCIFPRTRGHFRSQDVLRAVRTVRYYAADWGVDPRKIGVMGFSAGGHLAAMALTHFDECA